MRQINNAVPHTRTCKYDFTKNTEQHTWSRTQTTSIKPTTLPQTDGLHFTPHPKEILTYVSQTNSQTNKIIINLPIHLQQWMSSNNRHQLTIPATAWSGFEAIRIQQHEPNVPTQLNQMIEHHKSTPNTLSSLHSSTNIITLTTHRNNRIKELTNLTITYPRKHRGTGFATQEDTLTIAYL